jgi:hypothetical protein
LQKKVANLFLLHNYSAAVSITPLSIDEQFDQSKAYSVPKTLYKVAELLDATKLDYGDYSVKIYALPLVPVYVVLWSTSSEFPTSANILFDSSVGNYLSTEQIAILGELTSARPKHSKEAITY